MTTQDILTRVNAIIAIDTEDSPTTTRRELKTLAADLAAQVRMDCAAKTGKLSALRSVNTMLAYVKKHDAARTALHYPWIDKEGRQCMCDGFRAYRITDHLPPEDRPENAGEGVDLDRIFPDSLSGYEALPMPSVGEIKAKIALDKASFTGSPKDFHHLWSFGDGKPVVNAKYLIDLIAVLPDAAEMFWNTKNIFSPLYTKGERGEALLLPVKTAETIAFNAAQREAEKRDAAIREEARKDYAAQCEDYKRRLDLDPKTVLTPAEFERLTRHAGWRNAG